MDNEITTRTTSAHNDTSRKCAFTLAEVLITLGIIGVVAALTMPTLIANYKDKALETQVAKVKTTLANGYKLMMARVDTFDIHNLPLMTECNSLTDVACMSKYHKEAFSVAMDSPTLKPDIMPTEYAIWASEDKSPFKWEDVKYMFMTGDGAIYGVVPGENSSTFDIVVDVNGDKNPNVAVQDLRKFRFSGDGGNIYDVSEELTEQQAVCAWDNLTACTTQEMCRSLPDISAGEFVCPSEDTSSCNTFWDGTRCGYVIVGNDGNGSW